MSAPKNDRTMIPVFNLQAHHDKVEIPADFDLRDLARKYEVFPLKIVFHSGRRRLLLAMRNPFDHNAIHDVEFRAGLSVIPVQADPVDIQWLVQTHYFGRKLSPTPTDPAIADVSHNVFEQLEITTDAQKRPQWLGESLERFTEESSKTEKS